MEDKYQNHINVNSFKQANKCIYNYSRALSSGSVRVFKCGMITPNLTLMNLDHVHKKMGKNQKSQDGSKTDKNP